MVRNLRSRLLLLNVLVTLITLSILTAVSFSAFRNFQKRQIGQTVYTNLQITMDSIDRNYKLLNNMLGWLSINAEILAFVDASDVYPQDLKFKSIRAYNLMRNALYSNGLSDYINKLVILDKTGHSIQFGNVLGHPSDYQTAILLNAHHTGEFLMDPYYYSKSSWIFSMSRDVFSTDEEHTHGYVVAAVNPSIITRFTAAEGLGTSMALCIGDLVFSIGKDGEMKEMDLLDSNSIHLAVQKQRDHSTSVRPSSVNILTDKKGSDWVVHQGEASGWILMQQPPGNYMSWQGITLVRLLLFEALIMVIALLIITLIIDRTVNMPIHQINQRIEAIAMGDFTIDLSIEFSSEVGNIGRGINRMVHQIEQLIHSKVEHEKTKKDLEFRILQSQINPHFLYNTLNSIKWMASLQKATGIEEMVSSLAVLLKQLAKGTGQMIPLSRELDLVKEYVRIQDYRTAGMVRLEFQIEDPAFYTTPVIPFILQPIVENAIFHGIEPKQIPGTIFISVSENQQGVLLIEVEDNGQGILPERLPDILRVESHSLKAMNHIGLKNVDDRLKMQFGREFGLEIESRYGEFTRVRIRIPGTVISEEGQGVRNNAEINAH